MDVVEFVEDVLDPGGVDELVNVVELVDGRVRQEWRDITNPIVDLSDVEFKRRFRFHKDIVQNVILPLILDELSSPDERGHPIPPLIKLLTALRFYATGSFQIVCGDLFGVSQSSVSRIVQKVSTLLAQLRRRFIKFPTSAFDLIELKHTFQQLGRIGNQQGLPHIIGAVDSCHIPIERPHAADRVNPESFRNRKNYFSVNVQGTVGPDLQFLDIVARWPGQEHDSRIFMNSRLNLRFQTGELDGRLVGDSGYSSLRYLLTPVINPATPAEERFNACHIRTRNPVERTFGVWKTRFPCLRKTLANELTTSVAIIVACTVLHNIAILHGDELDEDEDEEDEVEDINFVPADPVPNAPGEGLAVRRDIIQRYFS